MTMPENFSPLMRDGVFFELACGFAGGGGEACELQELGDAKLTLGAGAVDRRRVEAFGGEGDGDDGEVVGDAFLLELRGPAFGGVALRLRRSGSRR